MGEAEKKTYYVASNDQESFNAPQAETIEGAISEAVDYYGLQVGDTVYVGKLVEYGNGERFYPSGDEIVERMAERAGDDAGEYAVDWLDDLPAGSMQELDAMIKAAICAWIMKHKLQPQFFTVEKVTERQVEADGAA